MTVTEKRRLLKVFEEEAWFWISLLGLNDWLWSFDFCDHDSNMANVSYSVDNRDAVAKLNNNWLDDKLGTVPDNCVPNDLSVRLCAFHEVFEVLLAEIEEIILVDPKNVDRINTERHRIIRRMENTFYPLKRYIRCKK